MKLEFLDDISDGGRFKNVVSDRLIRLYGFDCLEARNLQRSICEVILHLNIPLIVSDLDFIESSNCTLTFDVAEEQIGIVTENQADFFCHLTRAEYSKMVSFLGPFCKEELSGYQWLYDPIKSDIDLLFSPGGTW